jgi:glycerol-3-phosphate dehydrogenase (NAD(P)+)
MTSPIAVLGGGSWGTALSTHLARCGHPVRLWVRNPAVADALGRTRMSPAYLPGVSLPESVAVSSDLARVAAEAPIVLAALPSAACRSVYAAARPHLKAGAVLVSATKGLEQESLLRMTEVAAEALPGHPLAALSGPSFALEVAQGQPTAVVVASSALAVAEEVQHAFSSVTFRAYSSDDVVGVELAGALKNVIAIAAGIVTGLGYGHNTVAALITRGLAEITRLAVALGGRGDTLAGLAGLGDLVLTCTGALSRNRQVGQALGAGRTLEEALAATHMVAEGVWTTGAACALADRAGVEMPIARRMRAVLQQGQAPREAVEQLMLRSLKRE